MKIFIFKCGSYVVDVVFDVVNNLGSEVILGMYVYLC